MVYLSAVQDWAKSLNEIQTKTLNHDVLPLSCRERSANSKGLKLISLWMLINSGMYVR